MIDTNFKNIQSKDYCKSLLKRKKYYVGDSMIFILTKSTVL